ncbi:MAG: hypothetical protein KAW12_02090 [Candidatus Aminicenantes bacterium]|nr:hypothetical protein [Candidatus Aminicenantes bacterium]
MKTTNDKKKILFLAAALFVVNFLLYAATLTYNFQKDDHILVVNNPRIKSFNAFIDSIDTKFFTFPHYSYLHYWRPVTLFSFYCDYKIWGLDPSGYHLSNILLNAFNCVLLFLILFLMTGKTLPAFFVSLIFSIHPAHVEAVSWISGRTDLLAPFFIFISTIFYIIYLKKTAQPGVRRTHPLNPGLESLNKSGYSHFAANRSRFLFYLLSLLSFVPALLAKENAVVFPLFLLGLTFLIKRENSETVTPSPAEEKTLSKSFWGGPGGRFFKKAPLVAEGIKNLKPLLGFFVIESVYLILHIKFTGSQSLLKDLSLESLLLVPKTIGVYFKLIFLPFDFSPYFSMRYFDDHTLEFLSMFVLFVLIVGLLYYKKRVSAPFSLYSLLSCLFLLPLLNPELVPSSPKISIRFAYMAAVFAGALIVDLAGLFRNIRLKRLYLVCIGILAAVWVFESITIQRYYKDEKTYYSRLIKYYPEDESLLLPLSFLKAGEGNYREALKMVNSALARNKGNRWLYLDETAGLFKANLLIVCGEYVRGKTLTENIIRETGRKSVKYDGYLILSKYYEKTGDFPAALEMLKNAAASGETADLFFRMALIYTGMRDYTAALEYLEKAKKIDPGIKNYEKLKALIPGAENR